MTDLGADSPQLKSVLESFSSSADSDIEFFLHSRAVEFELLSKTRTYLVCDEEEITCSVPGSLTIYGYISIALSSLFLPEEISNRTRRALDGFSAKKQGSPITHIPCYLIGQLSRNSNIDKHLISGTELINQVCRIIRDAQDAVGGRFILIECRNNEKLISFYHNNNFREITRVTCKKDAMVQMVRKI